MASIISAGTTSGTALNFTGDTSGNLAFQTGAGANTITVPNSTGTIITTASPQSGSVLQVVQATFSGQETTTSTSFVATSLYTSITPKFSTSKIQIQIASICTNTDGGQSNYTIYRNSTNLGGGTSGQASFMMFYSSSGYQFVPITMNYLDSPATTSATTYKVYFKSQNSGTTFLGSGNILATITLTEIAA